MEFAMWAYPWDIIETGVEETIERAKTMGLDEINLATNYHTVHSFSPTTPAQRSYFARASAYFQPSASYGDIRPIPAEPMEDDDWVAEIAERVTDSPLSLNAWTVGCHNSRIGLNNPSVTITNAHGDSLPFGLCPSQLGVQSYLKTLVTELDGRECFDRIELETFDYFYGSGLGWHHDKVFVELGRLGSFLLGLCFCEECRANARGEAVDVEEVRKTCTATIDAIAAGDLPSTLDPLQWLRSHPSVGDYLNVRERTLTDLFAALRDIVDTKLGYYIGILDVGEEWMFGADLPALADYLDFVTVIAYEQPTPAADRVLTARELTPELPVHAGLQPGPPVVQNGATVKDLVDSVIDAGARRVSFYNYGPLPERSFEWIAEATEPYR